ncbi:MAG: hypothetical protein K2P12_00570, partial [Clostridia bacterium]|nr:hypothetical protein [Clostridia bacterium]
HRITISMYFYYIYYICESKKMSRVEIRKCKNLPMLAKKFRIDLEKKLQNVHRYCKSMYSK